MILAMSLTQFLFAATPKGKLDVKVEISYMCATVVKVAPAIQYRKSPANAPAGTIRW
jgi:hypothetical protein